MIQPCLAALALLAGAGCLYLAAPHQALVAAPLNRRALATGGGIALAVALVLLLSIMGPLTAVFTWTVGLMLVLSVAPVVIRWLRFRNEGAP